MRHGRVLRTERVRGWDEGDAMCRDRRLRRATQAEHGEAVIAPDEADGEDAAGSRAAFPLGGAGRRPEPLVCLVLPGACF